MMKGIIFGMVLLTLFAIPAMASEVYFEQQDSSVEIWADLTDPCIGGAIDMRYNSSCAEVIGFEPNDVGWAWGVTRDPSTGKEWITFLHSETKTGKVLIGTLTFDCECECETPLEFVVGDSNSVLSNEAFGPLDNVTWVDGTFTCGDEEPPECLGTCCNDSNCTDPFAENVSCKDCIDADKYWHPNEDEACFGDATPSDLCIDWCPECCDSDDNDGDGGTDFPADGECPCGLSPSEETGGPPIPELPTLALAGIGILGAILLARKRE